MSYSLVLSERALDDLLDGWDWYEDKQEGLGDKFKDTIYKCLNVIKSNPDIGTKRRRTYREVVVKNFPYIVIYKTDKRSKNIFISTIFHTGRNPAKKYKD